MNIATDISALEQLSQRLKHGTAAEHERMHQLMAKADVFSTREQYAKFTLAQYYFQRDVEHLFKYTELKELVPDLDQRGRAEHARLDLLDLGITAQEEKIITQEVDVLEALGWLYVSEGSTLGAAFLFKQAQKSLGLSEEFGARNLAAYPDGRAKVWKRFVEALDHAHLSNHDKDRVVAGAMAGFSRFGDLLEQFDHLH